MRRNLTTEQDGTGDHANHLEDVPTRYVALHVRNNTCGNCFHSVPSPTTDKSLAKVDKDPLLELSYMNCVPLK